MHNNLLAIANNGTLNIVVRITYFTVVLCVYVIVHHLNKTVVHTPVFGPLSNRGWQYLSICALVIAK